MKVALICQSDLLGGAAVVTYRLMHALRGKGIDARMLVGKKLSAYPCVMEVGGKLEKRFNFLAERGRIALSNGFSRKNLFKVSIADTGIDLTKDRFVREADIICLSWINQGLLSLKGIKKLASTGKPIVWTMHDMWNLTGICHHAYECTSFQQECGKCQYLCSNRENDLSHAVWKRKLKLYGETDITFVAVSNWLAGKARESSLLGDHRVEVIHNAFPIENFSTTLSHEGEKELRKLGIDPKKRLIVMGAARIDDPIKGVEYAIEALNIVHDRDREAAAQCQAVFFGDVRNPEIFSKLRFPHLLTGRVENSETIRHIYSAADIVLSTSLYETLPGTLIEGQASGALPVSFGKGGQADIVTHLKDGFIAEYKNAESVADGVFYALSMHQDREALHESVRQRFASESIATRYISLFNELLKNC